MSNLQILTASLLGGAFLSRPSDLLHLVNLHAFNKKEKENKKKN